ncbi:MAG: outer membrane protein assembly factor BamB, partial [Caballeronia mineralivorans]|nr:outer membrane protein assembly factor BamB [Caballeronia mineralivorans]
MIFLKRYALPLACAMTVMLTACATKDERRVPTPLVDIKPVL